MSREGRTSKLGNAVQIQDQWGDSEVVQVATGRTCKNTIGEKPAALPERVYAVDNTRHVLLIVHVGDRGVENLYFMSRLLL